MPPVSTLPPEYQARQNQLALQRMLSQALMSRGLQQPQGRMAGRFFVPPHPLENIGQLAQAAAGAYGQYQAGQKEVGLAKDFQVQQQQAVQQMIDAITGKDRQPQTGADLTQPELSQYGSQLTQQPASNFQTPAGDQLPFEVMQESRALRQMPSEIPGLVEAMRGMGGGPAQAPADPLAQQLPEMPDAGAAGAMQSPAGMPSFPTAPAPMAPPSGLPPTAGLTPGVAPQTGPLPPNWQTPPGPVGITGEVPYPPDLSAPLPPGVAGQVQRPATRESMMAGLMQALGSQYLPPGVQAAAGSMMGSLMKDRDTGQSIQTPFGNIAKEASPGEILRNQSSLNIALSNMAVRQQQNEMLNDIKRSQIQQTIKMDNHKIEQDKRDFERQVHTDEEKAAFKQMQLEEKAQNNLRHAQEMERHHRETELQAVRDAELKKMIAEMGQRKLKPGEEWTDETKTDVRAIKGSDLYKKQKSEFSKAWSETKVASSTAKDVADKVAWLLAPEQKDGFEASFGKFGSGHITKFAPYAKEYQQKLGDLKNAMKKFGLDLANAGGRSIGAIQVAEWDILQGMIASLEPGLTEATARETMEYIRSRVQGLANQSQDKFKVEFGNSQFMDELKEQGKTAAPPAQTTPATPQIPPGWKPVGRADDGTDRTVYEGPNGELRTFP